MSVVYPGTTTLGRAAAVGGSSVPVRVSFFYDTCEFDHGFQCPNATPPSASDDDSFWAVSVWNLMTGCGIGFRLGWCRRASIRM